MASSAATEAVHIIKGIENSGNIQSLQPAFSQEVEDDLIFTINVEFCGGLEQLTEDKTKEIQLRFTRQKKRNARTCSSSSSSSGTDRSHVVSNSINGSGGGSPHACGVDIAATGATARETTASHKERDISSPDAAGRSHEEDEAEESVPLYQLIGFVSSFVLSERSDMFADPYEGAPVDAAAAGAQRQHRGGQDGKSTYPIEYLLPGGFSPPMQLRPGVLALINDVDVEVLGGVEAPVHSSDCVTFISTLHGG